MQHFGLIFVFLVIYSGLLGKEVLGIEQAIASDGNQYVGFDEHKFAYNRALFFYHSAITNFESESSDLNRAIADLLFHIQEYPWAVLYYKRALKAGADYSSLKTFLEETEEFLGVNSNHLSQPTLMQQILLEPYLSLEYRYWLFFLSATLSFLLFSLIIWMPNKGKILTKLASASTIIPFLLLMNITFSYYFMSLEAIIVSPTGLYRSANKQDVQITLQPLLAGSKIHSLELTSHGEWLKIMNEQGLIGYIPASNARII